MTGDVALVTGAGSGVGRAIARVLAGSGWQVVLAGRQEAELLATRRELAEPGQSVVVPTDVSEEDSVADLFALVQNRLGRLDLLVNNAGIFGPVGLIDEVALADWKRTVDVNLTGAWLCARAAFRMMRWQNPAGGRIINITDLCRRTRRGRKPPPTQPPSTP